MINQQRRVKFENLTTIIVISIMFSGVLLMESKTQTLRNSWLAWFVQLASGRSPRLTLHYCRWHFPGTQQPSAPSSVGRLQAGSSPGHGVHCLYYCKREYSLHCRRIQLWLLHPPSPFSDSPPSPKKKVIFKPPSVLCLTCRKVAHFQGPCS